MGAVSGRDENKIETAGLTIAYDDETPYFEEAAMVLKVKKLYEQEFSEDCILDKAIDEKWYPKKDYHIMYICEIEKVLVKE